MSSLETCPRWQSNHANGGTIDQRINNDVSARSKSQDCAKG